MARNKGNRTALTRPVPAIHRTESAHAVIEPYQDDVIDVPEWYVGTYRHDVQDWHAVRPPETGKFQTGWSKAVMPLRAVALAFLWLTLYWWRTALALAAVLALVTLWGLS